MLCVARPLTTQRTLTPHPRRRAYTRRAVVRDADRAQAVLSEQLAAAGGRLTIVRANLSTPGDILYLYLYILTFM
jgi:hypothetical protein